ncbi:CDHR2 [Cervus elaphus hippelaphus]|uniref:CDHR2 n=1 Tax=Cervus elaphus hippelaphus TaxID=46360 RepID=A0A212D2P9_CEREH|nr:CDHR2 [Cervus elaphus hippelaphus]
MEREKEVPPDTMGWPWLSCLLLPALGVSGRYLPSPISANLGALSRTLLAANTAPIFPSNMSAVSLPEDLPLGAEAFWLVARDQENDELKYGISGSYAYFFSVTSNTGEVKLASLLDYETLDWFTINIFVSDSHDNRVQKEMQVIVEDRNDNAPVFQSISFSANVSEGSEYLFRILPNGSIILNGSLNYNSKSSFYQLELKACDSGGQYNNQEVIRCSSSVFVSISVIDKPDLDPQFVREFYSASVAEDPPQGTSVLRVEAMDGDRGINDPVIYSISNSTRPGWFDIGKQDGVITVNSPLDREQLLEEDEEVQVQVTATETHPNIHGQEAKASIWVTLRVTDVNDHVPEFYNCSLQACAFTPNETQVNFTGYVDEHASTRIPIEDLTMGNNGTFLLTLGGPDVDAFSVSPQRAAGSVDVQVLVRDPSLVDYERQSVMLVQVTATDSVSGNASVASVTIHLRDTNDHRPTFPHSTYNLSVFEHSAVGSVVTDSIQASDPDTGEGGRITYSLLPGNGELLDREKQAVYYLTLQATDGGDLSSSTTLQIHVLDINDNSPVVSGSYNIFVQEEEGNVSVTIQAQDDDQPDTNNSLLHFSLLPSPYSQNFSLDPDKGILRNLGPLDREAIDPALGGRIVLTVNVSDSGEPALWTTVGVTITVEDINDNLPIFNQSRYSFSVRERDPGVQVGVVEAWDADQTEANNRISFSLSGSGANNFMVRGSVLGSGQAVGRLSLPSDVSLDYETQASFSLIVSAENTDAQGREATAEVLVTVEDVNDVPPTLDSASLQGVRVAENGSQHGILVNVVAQDTDTMSQVEVQLVNVICTKAGVDVGSLCHGWFSVLANGSVFINQSEAIDYETCDLVTLVVRAYDARDDDSGNNGAILFSIFQVDFIAKDGAVIPFQGFFRISTSSEASVFTGNIELVTSLDSTLQGTYQVTVKAQDKPSEGLAQEARITLKLFTVDQSYRVRLQFSLSKEEVGAKTDQIKAALAQATRTTVYVVDIQDIDSLVRARGRSYLDAYFVFSNGSALTLDHLSVMIRNDQDSLTQLLQLGLVVLGSQDSLESESPDTLRNVTIGLGVALLLVIVIFSTIIMCTQKSYQRKLRAMKAAKEARKTAVGVMPPDSAIPGTNVYNTERANPMLNLPAKDLGFESQSSSSDLDHISVNSLDDNSVDLENSRQEIKARWGMRLFSEEKEPLHGPMGPDPEPWDSDHFGRKEGLVFTNLGLDTTDL